METIVVKSKTIQKYKFVLPEKLRMVLFVIILGTISASVLVAINYYTGQRILKNEELKIKASVLSALDIGYEKNAIDAVFQENVEVIEKGSATFYKTENGETAFEFGGAGFWGQITGIIALKADQLTIKGIRILHQEETPGLGARITEKTFLDAFIDKKVLPGLVIGSGSGENVIDAITGATMTGKALQDILNSEIHKFREILGE